MAKQTINIGSAANDGTGDPLRTAFDKVNDNFTELYTDDTGDVGSIVAGTGISVDQATGDVTVTNSNPNATHTGDVTGATALSISADVVDHDELAPRYTASGSITTLTGTVSFDCSTASSFKLSGDLTGTYTIDLSNYKKGQVITIYPVTGNQTLNLDAQGTSTNTFNKIGGVDYDDDGTADNIIQIECVDDSASDPVFFYSISTFASDSSDI